MNQFNNLVTSFEGITVGTVINNPDCGDYTVVAVNSELDRTLLVKNNSTKPNYIVAWALQKKRDGDGWYWSQGHYYDNDLEAATRYVLGIEKQPKTVWVIHTDWSIDSGEHDSDAYMYATYEIAKREFDKIVKEDKEVNYEEYNTDDSEYDYEESDNYWCIWERGAYIENHSEAKIIEHIVEDK